MRGAAMPSKRTLVSASMVSSVPGARTRSGVRSMGPMAVPKRVTYSPGATGPGAKLAAFAIAVSVVTGWRTVSVTPTVMDATLGSDAEPVTVPLYVPGDRLTGLAET